MGWIKNALIAVLIFIVVWLFFFSTETKSKVNDVLSDFSLKIPVDFDDLKPVENITEIVTLDDGTNVTKTYIGQPNCVSDSDCNTLEECTSCECIEGGCWEVI